MTSLESRCLRPETPGLHGRPSAGIVELSPSANRSGQALDVKGDLDARIAAVGDLEVLFAHLAIDELDVEAGQTIEVQTDLTERAPDFTDPQIRVKVEYLIPCLTKARDGSDCRTRGVVETLLAVMHR